MVEHVRFEDAMHDVSTGESRNDGTEYRAFISYSHAADGKLAPALQRGLHRLAKPWYRPPVFRVFRDTTSLTATPALWSSIETALGASSFFILLASPESAASAWVDREVQWWSDHKSRDTVLIVLTDGTLHWDDASSDFDPHASTAIPPALRGAFDEEPRWVDLRWARSADDVSLRNPLFRDAVADLASPLHGVSKEALAGEDVRQQRRTIRWRNGAMAALTVLSLVAATASVQFLRQRNVALEQRDLAVARELAAQSGVEAARQPDLSLLLAAQSVLSAPAAGKQAARDHLAAMLSHTFHVSQQLQGHTASVRDVAFSPDGASLITAAEDRTIRLWDAATGRLRTEPFQVEADAAFAAAFSPDGRSRAVGSGTVQLWQGRDDAPTRTLGGHDKQAIYAVTFSPDSRTVASAGADGTVRLWDAASGRLRLQPLVHEAVVWDVAFSPDGATLATAGEDHMVHLWNAKTGQHRGKPLKAHGEGLWDVEFSPDGATLASASSDGTVRLWDVAKRKTRHVLRVDGGRVTAVTFSPDGKRLATGDTKSLIRLWNPGTGQPRGEAIRGHLGPVWSLDFSPDGQTLASGSGDNTVRLWEVAQTRPLEQPLTGHNLALAVAFSPDGEKLLTGGADAGDDRATLRRWDPRSRRQSGSVLRTAQGEVWSLAVSPDGRQFVSGGGNGWLFFWDAATGVERTRVRAHADDVAALAFSADGKTLATASEDGTARLWDVSTGRPRTPAMRQGDAATGVALSPDGTRVAVSSADAAIRVWDVATGRQVGQPILGHTAGVYAVAYTPGGASLVSVSADASIRVWDPKTGRMQGAPIVGHIGEVWTLAVSPDGRTVASGGADGTVRLWDLRTRQARGEPLGGQTNWVWDIAFSPDGRSLAAASIDGAVRLWDLDPASWMRKACAVAGRGFSDAEKSRFLSPSTTAPMACATSSASRR